MHSLKFLGPNRKNCNKIYTVKVTYRGTLAAIKTRTEIGMLVNLPFFRKIISVFCKKYCRLCLGGADQDEPEEAELRPHSVVQSARYCSPIT